MNRYRLGTWVWGIIGAGILLIGAYFVYSNFQSAETVAPVIATLIATIGIVWSWFFQLAQKEQHHRDLIDLEERKLQQDGNT